jgi:hypothetical protein
MNIAAQNSHLIFDNLPFGVAMIFSRIFGILGKEKKEVVMSACNMLFVQKNFVLVKINYNDSFAAKKQMNFGNARLKKYRDFFAY